MKKLFYWTLVVFVSIAFSSCSLFGGGGKSNDPNFQISDLQGQLQTLTASKESELKALRDQHSREQLDFLVNLDLKGRHYANAELGDTNIDIAHAIIDKALKERKAVIVNDNGVLKLKQADNLDLDFLDGQYKPVSFSDFVSSTLAEKHLLDVQGNGDDDRKNPPTPPKDIQTDKTGDRNTSRLDAAVAASAADLES